MHGEEAMNYMRNAGAVLDAYDELEAAPTTTAD